MWRPRDSALLALMTLYCEIAYRFAKCDSESLQERTAAGGTCLIEEDVINVAVPYLETFHVLAADVDDEIDFGEEEAGTYEMGLCLNQRTVKTEGRLHEILTVTGGSRSCKLYVRKILIERCQE